MRRFETFLLVLACLLTLSACGGETDSQEPVQNAPAPGRRRGRDRL